MEEETVSIFTKTSFEQLIESLLKQGEDIDRQNQRGQTLLHIAIWRNFGTAAELLIKNGAQVNVKDNKGRTPLGLAVCNQKEKLVKQLLEQGAQVNVHDKKGNGALQLAVLSSNPNVNIIEQILDAGADLEIRDRSNQTPIFYAIKRNCTALVLLLLERGVRINIQDHRGNTPLHYAMKVNVNNSIVPRMLIERGANVEVKNRDGETVLHEVVKINSIIGLELLLERGVIINTQNNEGQSPLYMAVKSRFEYMMRMLLERGADVNLTDLKETAPLLVAIENNFVDGVVLLLKKGANINVHDKNARTPLYEAVRCRNETIVNILFQANPNVKLKKCYGLTPFHLAVKNNFTAGFNALLKRDQVNVLDSQNRTPLYLSVLWRRGKMTKELLDHKADTNLKAKYGGLTPLHASCKVNFQYGVDLLLKSGADVNVQDKQGSTPLHYAAGDFHLKLIERLLNSGADEEMVDGSGQTPLHIILFSCEGYLQLKSYLDLVCAAYITNKKCHSSLHLAVSKNNFKLMKEVITQNSNFNPQELKIKNVLHFTVLRNFMFGVKLLLENGVDANAQNDNGKTALHFAVLRNNETLVAMLLSRGADVNIADKCGYTPLHYAVLMKNEQIVNQLLNKGALFIRNNNGKTPLHFAARNNLTIIVKLLLDKGAHVVNEADVKGRTPLHDAVIGSRNNIELVEELISRGADVELADKKGYTPLLLGISYCNNIVVSHLFDIGAKLDIVDQYNRAVLQQIEYTNYGNIPFEVSQHLIKLRVANIDISLKSDLVDTIISRTRMDIEHLQCACLEELERMKHYNFGKSLTLLSVFCKWRDPFFVLHDNIAETLKSPIVKMEFPIYFPLLTVMFEKSKKRNDLLDTFLTESSKQMNSKISFLNLLPNELKRKIISYLSDKAIVNLITAIR